MMFHFEHFFLVLLYEQYLNDLRLFLNKISFENEFMGITPVNDSQIDNSIN